MHGHTGIPQHGLGPRGGDRNELPGPRIEGIAQGPQLAFTLHVFDLVIADGGLEHAVPVHQARTPIDETLAPQIHEGRAHRVAQPLVHGEGCARPVAGTSQATELLEDDVAVLLLPLPDLGQERLAPQVLTGLVVFGEELLLHDRLGRDARVIRPRNPNRVKA